MSTKKNRYLLLRLRIGFFRLTIFMPLRCLQEVVEGFGDFLSLFRWIDKRPYGFLTVAEGALDSLKDYGPLDLVNVDVKSPDARVKIKILMR